MKHTITILGVLGALTLPSAAQADVILEPGTKLTVLCGERPFKGQPFTNIDDGERLHNSFKGKRGRREFSDSEITFTPGDPLFPTVVVEAWVKLRRLEAGVWRLRHFRGESAIRWRGC